MIEQFSPLSAVTSFQRVSARADNGLTQGSFTTLNSVFPVISGFRRYLPSFWAFQAWHDYFLASLKAAKPAAQLKGTSQVRLVQASGGLAKSV